MNVCLIKTHFVNTEPPPPLLTYCLCLCLRPTALTYMAHPHSEVYHLCVECSSSYDTIRKPHSIHTYLGSSHFWCVNLRLRGLWYLREWVSLLHQPTCIWDIDSKRAPTRLPCVGFFPVVTGKKPVVTGRLISIKAP